MKAINHLFNYASMMNPSVSEVSSIGTFVSASSRQLADAVSNEIFAELPEGSLAHKIMKSSTGRFTDKQLWVIAFELQKNDEFTKKVVDFYEQPTWQEVKKAAKREKEGNESNEAKAIVKNAGRKLDDYYNYLKVNYKREYYSKRYSVYTATNFVNA